MDKPPFCVLFVTCPDVEQAKKLAQGMVESKLAACVTLLPKAVSCYVWKGKLETKEEVLLIVKTRTVVEHTLMRYIKENHSNSVPEIISLPIMGGDPAYLNWVGASTPLTRT